MGGNSITSRPRVTTTTPAAPPVNPSQAKVDKLLKELSKLDLTDRKEAITALKDAGLDGLAKALKSVVGSTTATGGSRPPERDTGTYTPPA
jgi:hypothetical protein